MVFINKVQTIQKEVRTVLGCIVHSLLKVDRWLFALVTHVVPGPPAYGSVATSAVESNIQDTRMMAYKNPAHLVRLYLSSTFNTNNLKHRTRTI